MEQLLASGLPDFVSNADRDFIAAFHREMAEQGYHCPGGVEPGHCWGRYMLVYTKAGVKSKKSYARIYLREEDTVLRLYLSDVDKHRSVVENAPPYIQKAFTGDFPACRHCHGKTQCVCQKHYTLAGKGYEICNGRAFWFFHPTLERLPGYMALFATFYPPKKPRQHPSFAR